MLHFKLHGFAQDLIHVCYVLLVDSIVVLSFGLLHERVTAKSGGNFAGLTQMDIEVGI